MNYFLISTGRGRSGALNYSLRQVGCGNPNDYFLPERWDTFANGIEGVRPFLESKRVNGFLGVRSAWGGHISEMCKHTGLTFTEFINEYMPDPKFVLVTRDPLRQALELMYIYYDKHPDSKVPDAIRADRRRVNNRFAQVIKSYRAWDIFFNTYDIQPYTLPVDNLVASPETVVPAVCEFLGYTIPPDAPLTHGFVDDYSTLPILDELYDEFMGQRIEML